DTHLDRARKRLGAADRYQAARLFSAYGRAAAGEAAVPIASGPHPVGISQPPSPASPDVVLGSGAYGRERTPQDRDQPGAEAARRDHRFREDLAAAPPDGAADARLHL